MRWLRQGWTSWLLGLVRAALAVSILLVTAVLAGFLFDMPSRIMLILLALPMTARITFRAILAAKARSVKTAG